MTPTQLTSDEIALEPGTIWMPDLIVKKHFVKRSNTGRRTRTIIECTYQDEIEATLSLHRSEWMMDVLDEDIDKRRKLVRLDEESGDGYDVYAYEYVREMDFEGFWEDNPDFDPVYGYGTEDDLHLEDEAAPYLKKVFNTWNTFLTRDGGLTFEMLTDGISADEIVKA